MNPSGNNFVLIMFDSPFHSSFLKNRLVLMNRFRPGWMVGGREGGGWLESLGPIIRAREISAMERCKRSFENNKIESDQERSEFSLHRRSWYNVINSC